ncbi:hypothetical protein LLB_0725 [Legionella longbeachae D-4968]|nr:hypothetical protein LLB_0725 [Legionella longbeachae D-4968]
MLKYLLAWGKPTHIVFDKELHIFTLITKTQGFDFFSAGNRKI